MVVPWLGLDVDAAVTVKPAASTDAALKTDEIIFASILAKLS